MFLSAIQDKVNQVAAIGMTGILTLENIELANTLLQEFLITVSIGALALYNVSKYREYRKKNKKAISSDD